MTNNKLPTSGLGRLYIPDARDGNYPIRPLLQAVPKKNRTWRYWWPHGWYGNQGSTPHCVAYSWLHWVEDGPITHHTDQVPFIDPITIYKEAQLIDEWPGENYDGTSVRAGAKILQKKNVIKEYRWAQTIDDIVESLLNLGPMVLGTYWYRDMFYPDENRFITPTGSVAGGHAYVLNGVNLKEEKIRIKNSWGTGWGDNGRCYIKIEDVEKLLHQDGEACIALENPLAADMQ